MHDGGYTKGISYSSAPSFHKELKDKKTRNIAKMIYDDLKVTGQSTHKIEPSNAFQMKGALTKKRSSVKDLLWLHK